MHAELWLPGATIGRPVSLRPADDGLVATQESGGEVLARAPYRQISPRLGGHNNYGWAFDWSTDQGLASLIVTDAASKQRLLQVAPPALRALIEPLQSRHRGEGRRDSLITGGVSAAIVAACLALIMLLFSVGPLIRWGACHVPVSTEQRFGDWVFKARQASGHITDRGVLVEVVNQIGSALVPAGSRYHYRWFVSDDASANAYAIPGGIVVVHRGLIAMAQTPEQLAGVLAHEIEHVEQRHSLQSLLRAAGLRVSFALLFGDPGTAGEIAAHLSGLDYSRSNERQADELGLGLLKHAGISPQGMIDFFAQLQKQQGSGSSGLQEWASTHPTTARRIADLRAQVEQMQPWPSTPLQTTPDWPTVREAAETSPTTDA